MAWDILKLKTFYEKPLGRLIRREVNHVIREFDFFNAPGPMAGVGYALPFLPKKTKELFALLPAQTGVFPWPQEALCRTALVDLRCLPLSDNAIARLLAIHCFSDTNTVCEVISEMERIVAPSGRILIVVPAPYFVSSLLRTSPFYHEPKFFKNQIVKHLRQSGFFPLRWSYVLPGLCQMGVFTKQKRKGLPMISFLERFLIHRMLTGALVIEAEKKRMRGVAAFSKSLRFRLKMPVLVPANACSSFYDKPDIQPCIKEKAAFAPIRHSKDA